MIQHSSWLGLGLEAAPFDWTTPPLAMYPGFDDACLTCCLYLAAAGISVATEMKL